MENNTTAPKEIYLLGQDLEFMVNDGRKDLFHIDASLIDVLGGASQIPLRTISK